MRRRSVECSWSSTYWNSFGSKWPRYKPRIYHYDGSVWDDCDRRHHRTATKAKFHRIIPNPKHFQGKLRRITHGVTAQQDKDEALRTRDDHEDLTLRHGRYGAQCTLETMAGTADDHQLCERHRQCAKNRDGLCRSKACSSITHALNGPERFWTKLPNTKNQRSHRHENFGLRVIPADIFFFLIPVSSRQNFFRRRQTSANCFHLSTGHVTEGQKFSRQRSRWGTAIWREVYSYSVLQFASSLYYCIVLQSLMTA